MTPTAQKQKLSRRQSQILDYIREQLRDRGFPPSIRDIGLAVGLSSSSTVHSHLCSLERKGFIRRDPSKPRSLQLVDREPGRVEVLEGLVREVLHWAAVPDEWKKRATTVVCPVEAEQVPLELYVDSFAGGGGASCGGRQALGRDPDHAINHDAVALAIHPLHNGKSISKTDQVEAVGNSVCPQVAEALIRANVELCDVETPDVDYGELFAEVA